MKKTGEILKKAREAKNLSLHEIGLSLKISNKVLKGIEEGDEKQLPAKTFLRGFVQSYANYLNLDADKVLDVFYEEMGSTRHSPYIRPHDADRPPSTEDMVALAPVTTPLKAEVKKEEKIAPVEASVTPLRKKTPDTGKADGMQSLRENKTSKTLAIVAFALVLVGLIIFTKKMIDKYSKEAEVPSNEVAQTMEGATPVVAETPLVAEVVTTENESEATPAASPLGSIATAVKSAPVSSQPAPTPIASTKPAVSSSPAAAVVAASPSPTQTPTSTPAATPSVAASAAPVAAATPAATPTPTPTPKPEVSKPVELIVEALDTVEIEYAAPNGKPQKIKLSAEQVHTFKSRSGLKISFSNGGAVNLIMNGKEVGIPGDLGKPIKLSY